MGTVTLPFITLTPRDGSEKQTKNFPDKVIVANKINNEIIDPK